MSLDPGATPGANRRSPLATVGIALLVATCGGGNSSSPSSPGAPSAPTAPQTITVSGQSALTQLAQTAQFSAKSGGKDVTTSASWQSANTSVATVSASGLVTAIGFGSAKISASYQGQTGSASLTVTPAAPSAGTALAACGAISTIGSYVLSSDLPPTGGPCLTVSNISSVRIDCQGHEAQTLLLMNVSQVSVVNCRFTGSTTAGELPGTASLWLQHASDVIVTSTAVTHSIFGDTLARVTFDRDVISAGIEFDRSSFSSVTNSSLTSGLYVIAAFDGDDNQFLTNTIDGGYDGSGNVVGSDDGVLLVHEINDVVSGNHISNVYDGGIEGAAAVANTTIADNIILNAGQGGIVSYFCTAWTGNSVLQNSVSGGGALMWILYGTGASQCSSPYNPEPPYTSAAFANNTVANNHLGTTVHNNGIGLNINLRLFPDAVSNNLISGNDIGSLQLNLQPLAGFSNGGSNICSGNPFCVGGLASTFWISPEDPRLSVVPHVRPRARRRR